MQALSSASLRAIGIALKNLLSFIIDDTDVSSTKSNCLNSFLTKTDGKLAFEEVASLKNQVSNSSRCSLLISYI